MNRLWVVRQAVAQDLKGILSVVQESVGAPHWSEAAWIEVLGGGSKRTCLVTESNGAVVGFVVAASICGVAELESVAVAPVARRCGVGLRLCESAVAWARDVGSDRVELEVRSSNEVARSLYETMGFQQQGQRRGYYRDPIEDAILMRMML